MKFVMIKAENCPTCGSPTVSESCHHWHTNGEPFEQRIFKCGCRISWSPNFGRLETDTVCPKEPNEVKRLQKRKDLRAKLLRIIAESDVDTKYKETLETYLPNWSTNL